MEVEEDDEEVEEEKDIMRQFLLSRGGEGENSHPFPLIWVGLCLRRAAWIPGGLLVLTSCWGGEGFVCPLPSA